MRWRTRSAPTTSRSEPQAPAIDRLIADLGAAEVGSTFNQYRDGGADDRDPRTAPLVRSANLRAYLLARAGAPVVAVAEAPGWRGARYSGIPLFSERMIDGRTPHYRRTSSHPRGFAEASATVVQGVLAAGGWSEAVLIWNAVPTHPAGAAAHSNRTPRRGEVEIARPLLERLLAIVAPLHVVAIGRTAERALPAWVGATAIRHPAQSGASLCRRQLTDFLAARLG